MVLMNRVAVGGVFAALLGSSAFADPVTLNFAHGFAPSHTVYAHGIGPWMECVKDKSAGDISFDELPSGQVVKYQSAIESLNNGVTQVSALVTAYSSDKLPINGITILPDMGDTSVQEVSTWRAQLDAGGPIADEFKAINVRPVLISLLPPYQLMSTKGPVTSMDGFKGLKVRAAGGSTNLMIESLGATAVEITTPDMYVALQRGTLDATALTLASVKTYGIEELVNAISTNGSFGSGGSIIAIAQSAYDGLADDQKAVLDKCGRSVEMELAEYGDKANEELKAEFAAMNIEMFAFSPELVEQINEAMAGVGDDYVSRLEARGIPAQAAYDAYKAALGK